MSVRTSMHDRQRLHALRLPFEVVTALLRRRREILPTGADLHRRQRVHLRKLSSHLRGWQDLPCSDLVCAEQYDRRGPGVPFGKVAAHMLEWHRLQREQDLHANWRVPLEVFSALLPRWKILHLFPWSVLRKQPMLRTHRECARRRHDVDSGLLQPDEKSESRRESEGDAEE